MGKYALPKSLAISDSGPPPNANYFASNRKFKGSGTPEGVVSGFVGDEYEDLDTNDSWKKVSPNEYPPRETKNGWVLQGGSSLATGISTGTTEQRVQADRWAEGRNLLDFGSTTNGLAALTLALAAWDTIEIDRVFSVSGNITIAAGKILVFRNGGKLKPASGVKITINGEVHAGRTEIFDYTSGGKVAFGFFCRMAGMFPEWWGAKPDHTTDNTTAFGRIFDSSLSSSENVLPILLNQGYYRCTGSITIKNGTIIRGAGKRKTRLEYEPAASGNFIIIPDALDHIEIRDVQIHSLISSPVLPIRTTAIAHLSSSHDLSNLGIFSCSITNFNQCGINLGKLQYLKLVDTEFTVSNLVSLGGTGAFYATCLNFSTFANAIEICGNTKTSNCDQFLFSNNSSNLTISNCRFEQDTAGGALIDAITSPSPFIEVSSGTNIVIKESYFEGNRAGVALISLSAVKGFSISSNRLNGIRANDNTNTCVVDTFILADSSSYGGIVYANSFYGTPASYYINNASTGFIMALQNTFQNSSGTLFTTYSQISSKITGANVEVAMASDINFSRALLTRITTNTTGTVNMLTLEKQRSGGAGGINDACAIAFRAMNDAGSVQNFGNLKVIYVNAGNGSEDSNAIFSLLGNGAITTPLTVHGEGGLEMPIAATNPAAPAANTGVLYFDSSGGKVRLVARFPTGAVQVIATEP